MSASGCSTSPATSPDPVQAPPPVIATKQNTTTPEPAVHAAAVPRACLHERSRRRATTSDTTATRNGMKTATRSIFMPIHDDGLISDHCSGSVRVHHARRQRYNTQRFEQEGDSTGRNTG